jgi:hypothetical protein
VIVLVKLVAKIAFFRIQVGRLQLSVSSLAVSSFEEEIRLSRTGTGRVSEYYFWRKTRRRKSGQNSLAMLFSAADSICAPQFSAVFVSPRSSGG